MNTCGTCKYFGARVEDEAEGYMPLNTPEAYHICKYLSQAVYGDDFKQPAHVIDGSGYYAALCVSPEYGCNQWEAAPEKEKGKTHS